MFATRKYRHPVHASSGALKATPRRHQSQLGRIDTQVPRVSRCHVPVLVSGAFYQPVPHPHVRNRINRYGYAHGGFESQVRDSKSWQYPRLPCDHRE